MGPIGVLCIQRTLSNGRRSGFVSGLGAASADAVYGAIAGFGITALAALLLEFETSVRVGGGLLLLLLGVRAFRTEPSEPTGTSASRGLLGDYGSTFLLTITNPMTILAFVGVFTSLGVGLTGDSLDASVLVLGVFVGSVCWWLCLSVGVDALRTRLTQRVLHRVNQVAGGIIVGFGLLALGSVL